MNKEVSLNLKHISLRAYNDASTIRVGNMVLARKNPQDQHYCKGKCRAIIKENDLFAIEFQGYRTKIIHKDFVYKMNYLIEYPMKHQHLKQYLPDKVIKSGKTPILITIG